MGLRVMGQGMERGRDYRSLTGIMIGYDVHFSAQVLNDGNNSAIFL